MRRLYIASWIIALILPALVVMAQTKGPKVVKRAQPPKFSKADNFYADAFKEGLVGERPGNLNQAASTAAAGPMAPGSATGSDSGTGGVAGSGWAAVISGPTIEN